MLYLKQSTASQSVLIGPFIDDTDGATPETGLTIANTDIRLSKAGGNLAAKNSGGGTHDEAGWYQITFDATDTNTVGVLQLHVKVAGALMVHAEYQVLEEQVYDRLFAASALGPMIASEVNAEVDTGIADAALATAAELAKIPKSDGTVSWNATALAAINAEADTAITDAALATASELAKVPKSDGAVSWNATALAAAADAVWDEALSGHVSAGSTGKAVADIETDATAILADTDEIGTAGAGLTALATAADLATVDTAVDAIKAKTDSLTFTKANEVDANIQSVNDVTVTGNGTLGNEWGP